MNSISIIGRLTNDIELKKTQSNISVCSFIVAVKRPHTKDTTDFIHCVAWRNTAEFIAKYFGKGNMIAVVGSLTTDKYTANDGKNRIRYNIVVDSVDFCGDKKAEKEDNNSNENESIEQQPQFDEVEEDGDLPF